MERDAFSENLRKATQSSLKKALVFVENVLKPPFRYRVCLNQSYDEHSLTEGEVVLKEIRAKGCEAIEGLEHNEVVDLLWRGGLVPEWVDIVPWQATDAGLTFELTCCGRFTEGEHLYHLPEGYPPFHAPGVWLPLGWKSLEDSGRFDLNWHIAR